MHNAWLILWRICLLQKAPEDVPYSTSLMWLVIGLSFLWQLFIREEIGSPLPITGYLVSVGIAVAFILFLLASNKLMARAVQTLTASFGAAIFIGVIVAFLQMIAMQLPALAMPLSILLLGCYIWSVVVDGHIIANALSIPFKQGIALAAMLFLLQLAALSQFIQPAQSAG